MKCQDCQRLRGPNEAATFRNCGGTVPPTVEHQCRSFGKVDPDTVRICPKAGE